MANDDKDNPAIPTAEELFYGSDPYVNDLATDLDGDGLTNEQEYFASPRLDYGEPDTDGFPEAQLVLNFANYTTLLDDLIKEAQIRQTASEPKVYKATLAWTGKSIPASVVPTPYQLIVDFAALHVATAPMNAGSPGARVPIEITFNIVAPQVAPNGSDWSWCAVGSKPYRARLINTNSVSALA